MRARIKSAAVIAMAALAACQQPETAEQMYARMQVESDSARVAIEARNVAFAEALNAGQADAVAAMFTTDATMMPSGMPAVTGRDNIRAALTSMFGMMPPGFRMSFETQKVTANGPLAVERGAWIMTVPTPEGGSTETRGKYIVEWRKVDGQWLLAQDIWNDDALMPGAPQS